MYLLSPLTVICCYLFSFSSYFMCEMWGKWLETVRRRHCLWFLSRCAVGSGFAKSVCYIVLNVVQAGAFVLFYFNNHENQGTDSRFCFVCCRRTMKGLLEECKMQQVFRGAFYMISKGHFWTQIKAPGYSFQVKLSLVGNQEAKPNPCVQCSTLCICLVSGKVIWDREMWSRMTSYFSDQSQMSVGWL